MLDLLTYAAAKSYTDNKVASLELDSSIYKYQGSVNTFKDLPTDAKVGYVYNVIEENGQNYCWTGEEWDALGQGFTIEDGSISLKKLEGSELKTFTQTGPWGASAPLIVNKDTNEIQETSSSALQDIVFKNIIEPYGSPENLGIVTLEWGSNPRNLSINTLKEYINAEQDASIVNLQTEIKKINSTLRNGELSWPEIQYIVLRGEGPEYFPIGYEFVVYSEYLGENLRWRVVGHNHHKIASNTYQPTMTLELVGTINQRVVYSPVREAFYYTASGLQAGTYYYKGDGFYDWYGGAGNQHFTLTQPLPAGGCLYFGMTREDGDYTVTSVRSYDTESNFIESVELISGVSGTYLGELTDLTDPTVMNDILRVECGSNNYAFSAVRQWLNSSATSNWYSRQSVFSPISVTYAEKPGFMAMLPEDFLSVVGVTAVECHTGKCGALGLNGTHYSPNSQYTVNDKFFLLSSAELGDSTDIVGTTLEFYENATNIDRQKYPATDLTPNSYWTRSPNQSEAEGVQYIYQQGNVTSQSAKQDFHCSIACTIGFTN